MAGLTKEAITRLLATSDKAVARALLVLHNNQTASEQRTESTVLRNNIGWRPCHARMGTSMATFYKARGFLTPKQVAYWRKEMACGNMRIAVYWRQLAEAAAAKAAVKETIDPKDLHNVDPA